MMSYMYVKLYGHLYFYFNCKVVNHLLKLTGTEHRVASAHHLQTSGLTERFNQTLKGSLIQVANEKRNNCMG